MSRESVAFNIKDPQSSVFGERSRLARQEPTTSEVLGAFIEEAFQGEGTLVQDIAASNIRKQERRGEPITQKTWKESNNFREGLSWYEGMTKKSAETLAKIEDERNERQNIFDRASGIQKGFGIGTQLITGIFEPKNFHSGQIAAIATAGVGSAAPTIGRLVSTKTVRGAATRGAVEGTLAAGFSEISSRESSRIVQGDYTMADTLMNFGLSMVLGAGIGAGAKGLEKRARGKRFEEIQQFRVDRDIAVKEFDTSLGQMTKGEPVNVEAVAEVAKREKAQKAVKELPVVEEKLNTKIAESKLTPVTERPEFKRWFEGSKVVDADGKPMVVYHGTNADITEFDLRKRGSSTDKGMLGKGFYFSSNPATASSYGNNVLPVYIRMNNPLEVINYKTKESLAKYLGVEPSILTEGGTGIKAKQPFTGVFSEAIKAKGHDGVITPFEIAAFKPEQIKSIFNRGEFDPNDPRLIDINEAEALQTKKNQLQQDMGSTLNDEPIDNLKKTYETNANSSAYDETIPQDVTDSLELAKQSDEKILQDNLEFMQEQVQELYEQGQLTDADVKNLEALQKIDDEIDIYDNIYSNLKNCLIR